MFHRHHLLLLLLVTAMTVGPHRSVTCTEAAEGAVDGKRLGEHWENWLRTCDHLVLMSTDPLALRDYSDAKRDALARGERLDVRGRLELMDLTERLRVAEAVIADVAAAKKVDMLCFNPRHEIQATKDGKVLRLVICYQCVAIKVCEAGKESVRLNLSGTSAAVLNQLLAKAGIPISK